MLFFLLLLHTLAVNPKLELVLEYRVVLYLLLIEDTIMRYQKVFKDCKVGDKYCHAFVMVLSFNTTRCSWDSDHIGILDAPVDHNDVAENPLYKIILDTYLYLSLTQLIA